jgi:hypothetical protein
VTAADDAVVEGAHSCTITQTATSTDTSYGGIAIADVIGAITDNDTAELTVGNLVVSEADGTATFTVTLSHATGGPFTLPFSFADVSTVAADFGPIPALDLNFAGTAGETQTVVIPLNDDSLDENNETASLTLGAPSDTFGGGLTAQVAAATLTIEDNDTAGVTVSESGGSTDVTEGGATDSYTVVLTSQPTHDVTITLSGGTQCTVSPSPLIFDANNWNTAQTVTVTAADDAVVEGAHSCTITQTATSTDTSYGGIAIADVTGTITDNDTAGVLVSKPSLTVSESGTMESFTVQLNSEPTASITVTVGSGDTGEGAVSPVTLTFTAADWDDPQTVTLTGVNDVIIDGDINYSLTLNPEGDAAYDALSDTTVAATTTDDDVAGVTVSESGGGTDVTEGGAEDTLDFVLDAQPAGDVMVTLTADGQCTVSPNPLTFTSGNWDTVQTVTVTAFNDDIVEGAHSCVISTAVTSGDSNFNSLTIGNVTADVTDNDTAGLVVSKPSLTVSESGTMESFTVQLNSEPTASITVTVGSGDTGEGAVSPVTLTFTAADWDDPQTVTLTGVNDVIIDGDISYSLTLNPEGDADYNALSDTTVAATTTDDDAAGLTVSESSGGTAITEGGATGSYTVVLTSQPTHDVTITLSGGPQCTLSPNPLTFTSGSWDTVQTVTVTAVDDLVVEGTHSCVISTAVTSGDSNFDGLSVSDVTADVTDNDTAGVTVSEGPDGVAVDEENATSDSFTVELTSEPSDDVTYDFSSGSQCTVTPASITFTPGDWNVSQSVTVTAVDDAMVETDPHDCDITSTVSTLDGNYSSAATPSVKAEVADNDAAGITTRMVAVAVEGGDNGELTVVLNSQPAGAVTVNLTPDSQCVLDGAGSGGMLSLTFTSADWSTPKSVTVIAVDDTIMELSPHECFVTEAVSAPMDPGYESLGGIGQNATQMVDVIDNDSSCPAQQVALSASPSLRGAGPEAAPMAAASVMSIETLDIAPAEAPTCEDVPDEIVREDMEALSYNFMAQRLNLISSNGPQLAWLGNRTGGFAGTNGFEVTGENGDLTGNFAFSSGGISNALKGGNVTPAAGVPRGGRGINAWVEGQFAFYNDERENEDASGDFFIGYAGVDIEVFENVNLGIMGEVDWMDEKGDDDDRVEGTGWMIGPYLSAQIRDGVFLDVRAMYGRSENSVRQINRWDEDGREVEHKGDFDTERLLAEATLSGNYAFNNTVLTPDIRFLYIREDQSDFIVNCICGPTEVDGQVVELGQLSGGLRLSQLIEADGLIARPFISGRLFWNIDNPGEMVVLDDNTLDARTQQYATDDLRGMVSIGLDGSTDRFQFGFEANYDGLFGDDDYAYGGRVSFGYRF